MSLVLWCDGSAIVISAVPTMMHCVSEATSLLLPAASSLQKENNGRSFFRFSAFFSVLFR